MSTVRRSGGLREFAEHSVGAVLMVCGLFALLGYMYMAGTADPERYTRHVPIAVVNADTGATLETPIGPQQLAIGDALVGGLIDNNDWSKIDLKFVSQSEAEQGLNEARYYGAITLPEDLSTKVANLLDGTTSTEGLASAAQVEVSYSPRVSIAGGPIAQRIADGMQASINSKMGSTLVDRGRTLAEARGGNLSATAAAALASPVVVHAGQFNPLPPGITNSTMPMFFALVVVLAGFTGAMVISNLLDARLGFLPFEVGPVSVAFTVSSHSRLRVLVRKWLVTVITAPLVSGIYLLIAHALGVGGFSYWNAFLFCVLGIIAVGVCAHSVIAALGSGGLLINLIVFVVLGIPTSGGATPPEMLPPLFRFIGEIEPMHQITVGLRSIMFFDSTGASGLTHASLVLLTWAVAGIVCGVLAAELYDRVGHRRQRLDERVSPEDLSPRRALKPAASQT